MMLFICQYKSYNLRTLIIFLSLVVLPTVRTFSVDNRKLVQSSQDLDQTGIDVQPAAALQARTLKSLKGLCGANICGENEECKDPDNDPTCVCKTNFAKAKETDSCVECPRKCGENETCLYNKGAKRNECGCKEDFTRQNGSCTYCPKKCGLGEQCYNNGNEYECGCTSNFSRIGSICMECTCKKNERCTFDEKQNRVCSVEDSENDGNVIVPTVSTSAGDSQGNTSYSVTTAATLATTVKVLCGTDFCNENEECKEDPKNGPTCVCKVNFTKDEKTGSCMECPVKCGENEICFHNDETNRYECGCKKDFSRQNGRCTYCPKECGSNEQCQTNGNDYGCECKSNFSKIGTICLKCICGNENETCTFDENQNLVCSKEGTTTGTPKTFHSSSTTLSVTSSFSETTSQTSGSSTETSGTYETSTIESPSSTSSETSSLPGKASQNSSSTETSGTDGTITTKSFTSKPSETSSLQEKTSETSSSTETSGTNGTKTTESLPSTPSETSSFPEETSETSSSTATSDTYGTKTTESLPSTPSETSSFPEETSETSSSTETSGTNGTKTTESLPSTPSETSSFPEKTSETSSSTATSGTDGTKTTESLPSTPSETSSFPEETSETSSSTSTSGTDGTKTTESLPSTPSETSSFPEETSETSSSTATSGTDCTKTTESLSTTPFETSSFPEETSETSSSTITSGSIGTKTTENLSSTPFEMSSLPEETPRTSESTVSLSISRTYSTNTTEVSSSTLSEISRPSGRSSVEETISTDSQKTERMTSDRFITSVSHSKASTYPKNTSSVTPTSPQDSTKESSETKAIYKKTTIAKLSTPSTSRFTNYSVYPTRPKKASIPTSGIFLKSSHGPTETTTHNRVSSNSSTAKNSTLPATSVQSSHDIYKVTSPEPRLDNKSTLDYEAIKSKSNDGHSEVIYGSVVAAGSVVAIVVMVFVAFKDRRFEGIRRRICRSNSSTPSETSSQINLTDESNIV